MIPPAVEAAERLRQYRGIHAGRLVIDADIHITDLDRLDGVQRHRYQTTPDYYHGRPISAEDAIREMDLAAVDMALAWQNPAATVNGGSLEANTRALTETNRYVLESARRYPERLIPAGWVDPKACGLDNTLELVAGMSGGECDAVRHATLTGEPLGSREFITTLEQQAGRRLRVLARGRPPKPPEAADPAGLQGSRFAG